MRDLVDDCTEAGWWCGHKYCDDCGKQIVSGDRYPNEWKLEEDKTFCCDCMCSKLSGDTTAGCDLE